MFNFSSNLVSPAQLALEGWQIVRTYATTSMSLPHVEEQLEDLYRNTDFPYDDSVWRPILSQIVSLESEEGDELVLIIDTIDREIASLSFQAYVVSSPATMPTPPPSVSSPQLPLSEVFSLSDFGIDPASLSFTPDIVASPPQVSSSLPKLSLPSSDTHTNLPSSETHTKSVSGPIRFTLKEYVARKAERATTGPPSSVAPSLSGSSDSDIFSMFL